MSSKIIMKSSIKKNIESLQRINANPKFTWMSWSVYTKAGELRM